MCLSKSYQVLLIDAVEVHFGQRCYQLRIPFLNEVIKEHLGCDRVAGCLRKSFSKRYSLLHQEAMT